MFAQDYSQALLKDCMSSSMNAIHPAVMTKLVQLIDSNGGLIFGSTIAAYLLRNSTMNGKPAKDIDILFRDEASYLAFVDEASKEIVSSFRSTRYDCSLSIAQSEPFYDFNDVICVDENSQTHITVSVREKQLDTCVATFKLHLVYSKSGGTPESTSIIPEKYVGYLFEHFFVVDFTKTVYYKGKIYSKLSTINVVSLATSNITPAAESIINKYAGRGIKFVVNAPTVVPTNTSALDLSTLATAKESYRRLGLVVIALRRRDKDCAGKSPAEKDWMNKTNAHDCDISKCDNIGLVCGPNSGIVCIDVDMKDDGMVYFQKLVSNYGLPACPTQETPNGGRHFIFKYNAKMKGMKARIKGAMLAGRRLGIDLWIDRCQFVAEPSINRINGKMYKWTTPLTTVESLPELPEWIYDLYFYKNITENGIIIKNDSPAPSIVSDTAPEPITPEPIPTKNTIQYTPLPTPVKVVEVSPAFVFQLDIESVGSYAMLIMLSILFIFMIFLLFLGVLAGVLIGVIVPKEHKRAIRTKLIQTFEVCVYAFK